MTDGVAGRIRRLTAFGAHRREESPLCVRGGAPGTAPGPKARRQTRRRPKATAPSGEGAPPAARGVQQAVNFVKPLRRESDWSILSLPFVAAPVRHVVPARVGTCSAVGPEARAMRAGRSSRPNVLDAPSAAAAAPGAMLPLSLLPVFERPCLPSPAWGADAARPSALAPPDPGCVAMPERVPTRTPLTGHARACRPARTDWRGPLARFISHDQRNHRQRASRLDAHRAR